MPTHHALRGRRRFPIRGLSLLVFASLSAGTVTIAVFARQVVADQEQRLLRQRAGEAAALLTNLVNQVQTSTRSLATVALATDGDPAAFSRAAGRDPGTTSGNGVAALIEEQSGHFRVIAAEGKGLAPGQELAGEAAGAARRARGSDRLVTTAVFPAGKERRAGRAPRAGGPPP